MSRRASCPLQPAGRTTATAALKHAGIHAAIPLLRAAVRYGPRRPRAAERWSRLVEPFFAWHWHDFVARARFGARLAGNSREVLQQHVYYFGAWEPDLTSWVGERLSEGDVCVDVGANIGYFSLLAATRVGKSGGVVAIEPSPQLQAALKANTRRNSAGHVRTVEVAAAAEDGTVRLFGGYEAHLGVASVVEDQGSGVEAEVTAAPLSSIVRPDEMRRVRLIKIDVEGAELEVLKGIRELWASARDDLEFVIEVHPEPMAKSGGRVNDLIEELSRRGLAAYRLDIDYSPEAYLSGKPPRRPQRLRGPVERHTHLVFSLVDAESL